MATDPPDDSDEDIVIPPPLANGRYILLQLLGRGGMATVWRAFDTVLERERAIKILHPECVHSKDQMARLDKEARAMAKLEDHPNVLRIWDRGIEGDRYYIVMELIHGFDLARYMEARCTDTQPTRPLPVGFAMNIARTVLEVLGAAHAVGIIHRDIKRENILITDDKRILVADFGIARATDSKLTRTSSGLGSLKAAAPEQFIDAKRAGPEADIFACGVLLFNMLTDDDETIAFHLQVNTAGRLDGVPTPFIPIIQKACAARPEDRYPSAEDMKSALHAAYEEYQKNPSVLVVEIDTSDIQPYEPSLTFSVEPPTAEVQEGAENEGVEEVLPSWPMWLKVGAGVGVAIALLSLGLGVRAMTARQEIVQPEVAPVVEVAQPVPEAKIEVQPEIKPVSVTVPTKTEVTSKPEVTKPDVVKNEVKPVVTPVVQVPAKARITAPAVSGKIANGSLSFSAGLTPVDANARGTLIYRVGSDPKWQRRVMQSTDGRYEVTIEGIDQQADKVEYVIEIAGESEGTLRSGSAQIPHVVKP